MATKLQIRMRLLVTFAIVLIVMFAAILLARRYDWSIPVEAAVIIGGFVVSAFVDVIWKALTNDTSEDRQE